jgi:hypothetical protein
LGKNIQGIFVQQLCNDFIQLKHGWVVAIGVEMSVARLNQIEN